MAKKDKPLVVPTSRPRNPFYNNPLMTRGGSMKDNPKSERRLQNAALAEVVRDPLAADPDFDDDDYGFSP